MLTAGRFFRGAADRVATLEPADQERERLYNAHLYDATRVDGLASLDDIDVDDLSAQQLLWIDVPTEQGIDAVAAALGLAVETVQALHDGLSQPTFFAHDRYIHVVIVGPAKSPSLSAAATVDCLVGSNWVLTVHREPIEFLARLDQRIRGDSELGKLDASGFLAAILHEHVAGYLAELRPIEVEIDRLDLRAMTGRVDEEALLRDLVAARIRVARLRRLLEPHRELFAFLARSEFTVLSGSEPIADFEVLTQFLERSVQSIEKTREMIVGSFEIYTTWTAHGTNKVIKRLTVASVTLLPPTLLAGIMGMNSLPSALASSAAFWITTALMVGVAISVLAFARRREWL